MPKRKLKSGAPDNPTQAVPSETAAKPAAVKKKLKVNKSKEVTKKAPVIEGAESKTTALKSRELKVSEPQENGDLAEVRKQEALITESSDNHHLIAPLLQHLVEKQAAKESAEFVIGVSQSLRRVFNKLAASGDLVCQKGSAETEANKAQSTLRQQFRDYHLSLLGLLVGGDVRLQASSLHALMDSIKLEWLEESKAGMHHELGLCKMTVLALCMSPSVPEIIYSDLMNKFLQPHSDLRAVVLKSLKLLAGSPFADLEKQLRSCVPETWDLPGVSSDALRTTLVEMLLRMPQQAPEEDQLWGGKRAEPPKPEGKEGKTKKPKDPHVVCLKLLGESWTNLLSSPLPRQVYHKVLLCLRKQVLPVLSSPLVLADMLTDGFDMGGVDSLLALDGLFVLMTKHNLDYPKFYPKLYSLCKPQLLQARHRDKFFSLLALSLTSSHLPASLVAAFAKRLARLSLTAQPPALLFLCTAVFNLLRRHPGCRYLINKTPQPVANPASVSGVLNVAPVSEPLQVQSVDPFLPEEDDPSLSQATESSLWEMQTLTHHYCPQVVRVAKELFAENALKSKDLDISATLQHTYLSLIESELEWRKNQPTPLTYESAGVLFTPSACSQSVFSFA